MICIFEILPNCKSIRQNVVSANFDSANDFFAESTYTHFPYDFRRGHTRFSLTIIQYRETLSFKLQTTIDSRQTIFFFRDDLKTGCVDHKNNVLTKRKNHSKYYIEFILLFLIKDFWIILFLQQKQLTALATISLGGTTTFASLCIWNGNENFYRDYVMPFTRRLDPETSHQLAVFTMKHCLIKKQQNPDPESLVSIQIYLLNS